MEKKAITVNRVCVVVTQVITELWLLSFLLYRSYNISWIFRWWVELCATDWTFADVKTVLLLWSETRWLLDQSSVYLRVMMSSYQRQIYLATSVKDDCFWQNVLERKARIQKHWNCWIASKHQKPLFRQPWYICLLASVFAFVWNFLFWILCCVAEFIILFMIKQHQLYGSLYCHHNLLSLVIIWKLWWLSNNLGVSGTLCFEWDHQLLFKLSIAAWQSARVVCLPAGL